MNKTVSIVLGVVLIVGGGGFTAMNAGPFQKAFKLYGDKGSGDLGSITEVKVLNGKSEVYYEYELQGEVFAGMSVMDSSQFTKKAEGTLVPVVYAEDDRNLSRLQDAGDQILDFGRNLAIGGLLAIIGLALALRRSPGTSAGSAASTESSSAGSEGGGDASD